MGSFVKVANVIVAVSALESLGSTLLVVGAELQVRNHLFAELAGFWLHLALLSVVAEPELGRSEGTVRADYVSVRLGIVILLVGLCDAEAALLALVVLARAADVVHSELREFDLLFTEGALFGFFLSFHV